jgi:hypothetical protein
MLRSGDEARLRLRLLALMASTADPHEGPAAMRIQEANMSSGRRDDGLALPIGMTCRHSDVSAK